MVFIVIWVIWYSASAHARGRTKQQDEWLNFMSDDRLDSASGRAEIRLWFYAFVLNARERRVCAAIDRKSSPARCRLDAKPGSADQIPSAHISIHRCESPTLNHTAPFRGCDPCNAGPQLAARRSSQQFDIRLTCCDAFAHQRRPNRKLVQYRQCHICRWQHIKSALNNINILYIYNIVVH